jgi:hypothetical protein
LETQGRLWGDDVRVAGSNRGLAGDAARLLHPRRDLAHLTECFKSKDILVL